MSVAADIFYLIKIKICNGAGVSALNENFGSKTVNGNSSPCATSTSCSPSRTSSTTSADTIRIFAIPFYSVRRGILWILSPRIKSGWARAQVQAWFYIRGDKTSASIPTSTPSFPPAGWMLTQSGSPRKKAIEMLASSFPSRPLARSSAPSTSRLLWPRGKRVNSPFLQLPRPKRRTSPPGDKSVTASNGSSTQKPLLLAPLPSSNTSVGIRIKSPSPITGSLMSVRRKYPFIIKTTGKRASEKRWPSMVSSSCVVSASTSCPLALDGSATTASFLTPIKPRL